MNKELLAELIGIILGDGNLHKKSNCITITGSLEDLHYYELIVIPLFQDLFSKIPKLRKRNDRNSYYLQLENKTIFDILLSCGLRRGNKTENASIPQFIISNKKLIKHFLRGLFDTDGCLKFSKQSRNTYYYPRIQIGLKESALSLGIRALLKKLEFNFSQYKDKKDLIYYQISGKKNLEKWMREIGSNNPVHKTKYLVWKKQGFYMPKSSLESRLKTLDLNKNFILSQ